MYNSQLTTFVQVADSGSFNKAAEALYISSTAVIKQINALEKHLDLCLENSDRKSPCLHKSWNTCAPMPKMPHPPKAYSSRT